MNSSDSNPTTANPKIPTPVTPIADGAGSRNQNVLIGCILSIVVLSCAGFLGLGRVAAVYLFQFKDGKPTPTNFRPEVRNLRINSQQEFKLIKEVLSRPPNAREHPKYEQVVTLINSLQPVLNEQANPELKKYIDVDLFSNEIAKHFEPTQWNSSTMRSVKELIADGVIGPPAFTSYELTHIEDDGPQGLRVFLDYSIGYQFSEPHVWWISDKGQLRLYDWFPLELGMRESAEYAARLSASSSDQLGFLRYANLSSEYVEMEEQNVSISERRQRIKAILEDCERYYGPSNLRGMVSLITARRWYLEGELTRAWNLLLYVFQPDLVPGVYSLKGRILYDQNQFEQAAELYRQYISVLGPSIETQTQLAKCYRKIGDVEAEREALEVLTRSIHEANYLAVAQLVEINDATQNHQLFSRIDALSCRDDVYRYLVNHLSESEFFSDRSGQLYEHLQMTAPQSGPSLIARAKLFPEIENFAAVLKWLEAQSQEEVDSYRYKFWLDLDESNISELFRRSSQMTENFSTICEIEEYEANISDEIMLELCDLMLESRADDSVALYKKGVIQSQRREYPQAIDCFRKSLASRDHDQVHSATPELLSALYESGDEAAALSLAIEPSLASQLLELKLSKNDYSSFAELLQKLEPESSDAIFYRAILSHHNGESESAIEALAELVRKIEQSEPYNYRGYLYRRKLLEFCEQQGNIVKAYALVPTTSMFNLVSERLLRVFDWAGCERLLALGESEGENLQLIRLGQRIAWEQGNYQQIVEQADLILEMAGSQDLAEELERLVRSALRCGEINLAMKFAQAADRFYNRKDLVVLVALRQNNTELLEIFASYFSDQLYFDADLLSTPWREMIPSDKKPLRQFSYFGGFDRQQFEVRVLYSAVPDLNQGQLEAAFSSVFGDDVGARRFEFQNSPLSTWSVNIPNSRLLITTGPWDGHASGIDCDDKSIKDAIAQATHQVRIVGFANTPTSPQADYDSLVAAIMCLPSENLLAAENDYKWLTAAEIDRFKGLYATQATSEKSRLFRNGEFQGVTFFMNELDDNQNTPENRDYQTKLAAALRRLGENPISKEELVIQFHPFDHCPELIAAKVDRIERTGYGGVLLQTTVLHGSIFDGSILEGDRVIIYPEQVRSFEFKESSKTSKQSSD